MMWRVENEKNMVKLFFIYTNDTKKLFSSTVF